ncbi:MAG: hypothetical protein AB1705_19760 [Verrucomicrobiota bacterium]
MKRILQILVAMLFAGSIGAVPPVPPTKNELIDGADFIAVISISKIDEKTERRTPFHVLVQTAQANVERVLKGEAPAKCVLRHEDELSEFLCKPPKLATGRFLVFLKRQGDVFVQSNWYSIFPIEEDKLAWIDRTSSKVWSLEEVTAEIVAFLKKQ